MRGKFMEFVTRDFGKIEAPESDIVTFAQPIYGFEALRKYIFLFDERSGTHFAWLQSVEEPEICFLLINPAVVDKTYAPTLPSQVKTLLGEGTPEFWLIAVIAQPFENSTVNLKSPVVVNVEAGRGVQVILEDSFPIRFPLSQRGEEAALC